MVVGLVCFSDANEIDTVVLQLVEQTLVVFPHDASCQGGTSEMDSNVRSVGVVDGVFSVPSARLVVVVVVDVCPFAALQDVVAALSFQGVCAFAPCQCVGVVVARQGIVVVAADGIFESSNSVEGSAVGCAQCDLVFQVDEDSLLLVLV